MRTILKAFNCPQKPNFKFYIPVSQNFDALDVSGSKKRQTRGKLYSRERLCKLCGESEQDHHL